MRLPVLRLVVAYLGVAVALYGLASLTGCWLGKPPWWERTLSADEEDEIRFQAALADGHVVWMIVPETPHTAAALDAGRAREGRERVSGALAAAGFLTAVAGFASAWPRRREQDIRTAG